MQTSPNERSTAPSAPRIAFGHYLLDIDEARLTREGAPIDLPPRAFGLLAYLARQPGRLVRKDAVRRVVTLKSGDFDIEMESGAMLRGSRRYRPELEG